jgi:hypothetical protein
METSTQPKPNRLLQWISQNKKNIAWLAAPLALLLLHKCHENPPVATPVQKEETKLEKKVQKKKSDTKHVVSSVRENKAIVTTVKEYDKKTGTLTRETKTEIKSEVQKTKDTKQEIIEDKKVDKKEEVEKTYTQPHTGITIGAAVLPSGSGVTAGATIAELPPLTVSTQLVYLVQPQPAPAIGVSLNGTIAPSLEAGIGVYVGPATPMGYSPVPGAPVSIQPGVIIQYRF